MTEPTLQNRTAIVTGGARGIGRAVVHALSRAGAHCIFTYVTNQDAAEAVAAEARDFGGRVLPVRLDVRDFDGAAALVERAKAEFGRLDMLVNNAGITRDRSLMGMSRQDWADVIDTDLTGVFNMTRACIITFLKQRSGGVVNVSSVGGIRPLAGQVNYAAAKAGVIGFTKSLAKEVAPYGVRVNAVAPGFIDTDMTSALGGKARERAREAIPLGRFGSVDDVAAAVLFLLSDASQYITGQTIQIDGGLGM
jgi:3-oxoacyl-[acyl-carrier protein] reductase